MTEICTFSTFTHVCQTYQHEILRFLMPFLIFSKKNYLLGHKSTFSNFEAKLQKSKKVLRECVLDLNFAPIKESVFLIY